MASPPSCCSPITSVSPLRFLSRTGPPPSGHHGGPCERIRQPVRGCSVQVLRLPGRRPSPQGPPASTPESISSNVRRLFGSLVDDGVSKHLAASSRRQYGVGVRAFIRFCSAHQLEPDLSSLISRHEYALFFAVALRLRPLTAGAIDSYISHVTSTYIALDILQDVSQFRSPRLRFLLDGYSRLDASLLPIRDRLRIPVSFAIVDECLRVVDAYYTLNPDLRLALRAAFSLGYGLSLRPSEYLLTDRSTPLTHQLDSSRCHFWWDDRYFSVLDTSLFPPGLPSVFSSILPFSKNHQLGSGGTHSVGSAPPTSPLCFVTEIYQYVPAYPPTPNSPFLSAHGSQLHYRHLRYVLHLVAKKLGLPASRLVPASLRSGAVNQLTHLPVSSRLAQGDWRSEAGLNFYLRPSVAHAFSTRDSLYDLSRAPLSHTEYSLL